MIDAPDNPFSGLDEPTMRTVPTSVVYEPSAGQSAGSFDGKLTDERKKRIKYLSQEWIKVEYVLELLSRIEKQIEGAAWLELCDGTLKEVADWICETYFSTVMQTYIAEVIRQPMDRVIAPFPSFSSLLATMQI